MFSSGPTDTILDVAGLAVGHAQDNEAMTGLTVLLSPAGAVAGGDLRGGGSGLREANLLDPRTTTDIVHAIVLSGGSAFGLDASGGVMTWLEEQGIGFDTGVAKVPLVPQAILFDLGLGSSRIRPDQAMARKACSQAITDGTLLLQGNVGAGTGASIGKLRGGVGAMKSGIASASIQLAGGFTVGALVAVNALGDVYENGQIIAGMLDVERGGFADSSQCLLAMAQAAAKAAPATAERVSGPMPGCNTTIGIIACNGRFTKAQCGKIAAMGHNGMARAIRPVHTTADGDMLFCLATGEITMPLDAAGEMAAIAVERAIIKAVKACGAAGGLPAWQDFQK